VSVVNERRSVSELGTMFFRGTDPIGDSVHVCEMSLVGFWREVVFRHGVDVVGVRMRILGKGGLVVARFIDEVLMPTGAR